jgi:hypothetical protein
MRNRDLIGFLVLFSCVALAACNGDGGEDDGGTPDADGAGDGGDDPGGPFKLVFENGAQACAQFSEDRSAAQELALRGRMVFKPGTLELPRDAESFEADIIQELQVTGPDPVPAQPGGAGEILHEFETDLWGHCHHYTFTQPHRAGARPVVVQAEFSFCKKNNVTDPEELHFDQDNPGEEPRGYVEYTQVKILGLLDNGEDYLTEKQFYRSCTYATLPLFQITVDLEGGDRIVLWKRYWKPLMASGPAAVTRAEVDLDGEQRTVEDYFHTAYAADLHNYNERYLVVLDPPVGNIHGIRFEETNQNDPPAVVDLLDETLDPFAQRNVTGYADEEAP